jgi:hypothetical protein
MSTFETGQPLEQPLEQPSSLTSAKISTFDTTNTHQFLQQETFNVCSYENNEKTVQVKLQDNDLIPDNFLKL